MDFYIAYIHPYFDGNGRIARLVHLWFLIQKGYQSTLFVPFSSKIEKTRKAYYNAYTAIEENKRYSGKIDITPFLIYFADNVYNAYNEKTTEKIFSMNTKSILIMVKSPKKNPCFGNLYCQITVQTNFPPKCLKKIFKMPRMPQ